MNFMVTESLEICKGFDRKNDSGCKVSTGTIFDGQIPYKIFEFYIVIISTSQMPAG